VPTQSPPARQFASLRPLLIQPGFVIAYTAEPIAWGYPRTMGLGQCQPACKKPFLTQIASSLALCLVDKPNDCSRADHQSVTLPTGANLQSTKPTASPFPSCWHAEWNRRIFYLMFTLKQSQLRTLAFPSSVTPSTYIVFPGPRHEFPS
jgi:hypothetical protein